MVWKGRLLHQDDIFELRSTLQLFQEISNRVEDAMGAATVAGIKGAELKFITSPAGEVSILKSERERERVVGEANEMRRKYQPSKGAGVHRYHEKHRKEGKSFDRQQFH
ncbi:hypothetical protein OPV22_016587 [Ensete ventricosum]|uniref:Uncharacterized protein n=1 Tax=Ensete ventricosum TaxID=4639 RepID=A0AAV8QW27_ENSVE|nr:hypothetical protein OPV22_016587 [Ensete ventricosum]